MSPVVRHQLLWALKTRAFSLGSFTLASGRTSTYYINSKKAIFNSEVSALLAEALYEETRDLAIEAAGGLEVGAIPLTAYLVQRYHQSRLPLEGFFVRKEAKDHGSKERLEGLLLPGSRVAILDDVVTTGSSVSSTIQVVENAGATVAAVVCVVDRLEGAREALAGYEFRPLFTIRDFGVEPPLPVPARVVERIPASVFPVGPDG